LVRVWARYKPGGYSVFSWDRTSEVVTGNPGECDHAVGLELVLIRNPI